MAYGLHIERVGSIEMEEWVAAVSAHPLLQLDDSSNEATNPSSGQVISIPGELGTASLEVLGNRRKIFRWRRGKISFKAPSDVSEKDPIMAVAFELAEQLSASVCGDEGELYERSN